MCVNFPVDALSGAGALNPCRALVASAPLNPERGLLPGAVEISTSVLVLNARSSDVQRTNML